MTGSNRRRHAAVLAAWLLVLTACAGLLATVAGDGYHDVTLGSVDVDDGTYVPGNDTVRVATMRGDESAVYDYRPVEAFAASVCAERSVDHLRTLLDRRVDADAPTSVGHGSGTLHVSLPVSVATADLWRVVDALPAGLAVHLELFGEERTCRVPVDVLLIGYAQPH